MSAAPPSAPARNDFRTVGRQLYYEQLAFWRNPFGAVFTVGFSLVFLFLLGAAGGTSRLSAIGNLRAIQYYVPGFIAYGVMSACFNLLSTQIVVRREMGLLKRLHLSPLPTWALLSGIFLNAFVISMLQAILLLAVGRFAYHVALPFNWGALVVALLVGVVCFTALGVGVASLLPNQESATPIVSILYFVLLFLSGLWFPLTPHSGLADVSGYFPVRHLILAVFAPFDRQPGVTGWSWHDILVLAIWGVLGTFVAIRRFRWEPHVRRG